MLKDHNRMTGLKFLFLLLFMYAKTTASLNITIGYLMADRSLTFKKNLQGRIISGAMTYVVDKINNDTTILKGHRLNFRWEDTHAVTLEGTRCLTELWKDGAVAFFGPEDSCDVEATIAASWNLPMISYVSTKDLMIRTTGFYLHLLLNILYMKFAVCVLFAYGTFEHLSTFEHKHSFLVYCKLLQLCLSLVGY